MQYSRLASIAWRLSLTGLRVESLTIFFFCIWLPGGRHKWVPLNLEGAESALENSANDSGVEKSPTSPEATSPTTVNPKATKSPTTRFSPGHVPGNVSPVRGGRGGRGGGRGGRGGRGRRSPRGAVF